MQYKMRRITEATETVDYRGTTLGRRPRHRWAVWHVSGWIDTGETRLSEAKRFVDHLSEAKRFVDPLLANMEA